MTDEIRLDELEQATGGMGGSANFVTHIVAAGDTLSAIAKRYNTSVEKIFMQNREKIIREANAHGFRNMSDVEYSNHIFPGTKLIIPLFN